MANLIAYCRNFWMCFLSSHAVFMYGARHNNKPAHRHKTYICRNLENQLNIYIYIYTFSDYVVRSTVAERASENFRKHANRKSTSKSRKHLHQFDNTHAANVHNTTKYMLFVFLSVVDKVHRSST